MRLLVLIVFILLLPSRGYAQEEHFRRYDYGDIGLTFMVPAHWEHDGLNSTTKAAFIKHFGWLYDEPDASDIWNAFGSFSSVSVDSTLLPSDSALTMHKMTIFVNRAHTLYRRWLCLQQRESVLKSKPLINSRYALIKQDRISSFDLPENMDNASAKSYLYYTGDVELPTMGHLYTFVHEDKCYEIRLESTMFDPAKSVRMHERIISSVERVVF